MLEQELQIKKHFSSFPAKRGKGGRKRAQGRRDNGERERKRERESEREREREREALTDSHK